MLGSKRIALFAGHYGSGKTNIAVNMALILRQKGLSVAVADLDIVNPYFRTKDSAAELEAAGIRMISSIYANSNVDVPALPGEAYAIIDDRELYAVVDVGGDDRGALALGRYAPAILEENNYNAYLVINKYRPLTRTVEDALAVMCEVETAAGLPFTGIINNSNIGADTTVEDIYASVPFAEELSRITKLPVVAVTARDDLAAELKLENVLPITLHYKPGWAIW